MRLVFDQSLSYTAADIYDGMDMHSMEELLEYQDLLADYDKAHQKDEELKR